VLADDVRVAIDDHVRLLLAWNASINLTAIRDPAEIAVRHVADSLAGLPLLNAMKVDRLLDLGSGGGYPAIPLAVAMALGDLVLVESVRKKARFLDAALGVVGRTIAEAERWRTEARRAEAVARDPGHRGRWPVVTARAVASLAELVELSFPLLEPGGSLLAWKAGDPAVERGFGAELAAAARAVETIGGNSGNRVTIDAPLAARDTAGTGVLATIGEHRLVVVERGGGPIDDRWPRDPAERRRRPWA
jgi:16S rRNA (guanine527-N7)-methyltransferase